MHINIRWSDDGSPVRVNGKPWVGRWAKFIVATARVAGALRIGKLETTTRVIVATNNVSEMPQ